MRGAGRPPRHCEPAVYPATLQLSCVVDGVNRGGTQGASRGRGPQNNAGNARQQYARYLARAREASLAGDVVEMEENCYQHAEH
jgi:hypothetical protein